MADREIKNLDLKIKFTNEYLRNGGIKKIPSPHLLDSILSVEFDKDGKADPTTVNGALNAFMMLILQQHLEPPFYSTEHISEYASLLQKSLFFEQETIDTEEQFDQIYERYRDTSDILFRGQREAKWRLYSGLQRQWITERLYERHQNFQAFLESLIKDGRSEYSDKIRELLGAHDIDSENDVAVLGFLQHHGCPTPLLDWTFKFQNALYFGMDGLAPKQHETEIEDYFSLYHLEEEHFEEGSMRKIITHGLDTTGEEMLDAMIKGIAEGDEAKLKEMQEKFKGRKLFDKSRYKGSGLISHMTAMERLITFPLMYFSDRDSESGIIFSLNNSKNILNQAGVFTWNADPSKPLEMVGNELYGADKEKVEHGEYAFCKCYNINKRLEPYIRTKLQVDGITKEHIYPTHDINTYPVYEKNSSYGNEPKN